MRNSGNQDGGRAIIEKSQKRIKLDQMKRYRLESWWGSKEWANKCNGVQKCGILGNQDGGRVIIGKS